MAPLSDPDPDPDIDAVLRTLLLPFEQELLPRLDGVRVLMLNARASTVLPAAADQWRLQQDFRPHADALARMGLASTPELPTGEFDVVLLPAPRQRQHGRALLAQGFERLARAGVLVACAGNDTGGRSLQRDLDALAGATHSLSKNRCRACWAMRESDGEVALARAWREADAPTVIAGGRFHSRPGVFAWDRIDPASALLAASLPTDLHGRGADLGCGYGYLAAEVLARNPGVAALDLYEADARALALARGNLHESTGAELGFHWHDVAAGLPRAGYDFIVSNPPFHEGRADRPELGIAFIRAAAAALRTGGSLFMVANRHLPYEATLAQEFARVRTLADQQGFKVIEATRA
ncbi:MAG: class I SAM-dependent methyltransferase [Arenimonas sp.]